MIRQVFLFIIFFLPIALLISCRSSRVTGPEKQIALTFDDGPDSVYTEKVLKVLRRHHVHATFFLIGSAIEKYPSTVKKIEADGHCIGNHSYHHLNFWNLSCEQLLQEEILRTQEMIFNLTGRKTRIYRPPYGYILDSCKSMLESRDYVVVRWDIDPVDWDVDHNSVKNIEDFIKISAGDHCSILMHCGNGDRSNTVKALPHVIHDLERENYRFVRLDELLKTNAYFP
jgi:peptidoglycan/xylan/chitin deacetylase (PgdA/CDA1 family)